MPKFIDALFEMFYDYCLNYEIEAKALLALIPPVATEFLGAIVVLD